MNPREILDSDTMDAVELRAALREAVEAGEKDIAWAEAETKRANANHDGYFFQKSRAEKAEARVADLEAALKLSRSRAVVCLYCRKAWPHPGGPEPPAELVMEVCGHEAICPENPYTKRIKELETVLGAWHSIFGTTQLSHAEARLNAAEDKARLEGFRAKEAESSLTRARDAVGRLRNAANLLRDCVRDIARGTVRSECAQAFADKYYRGEFREVIEQALAATAEFSEPDKPAQGGKEDACEDGECQHGFTMGGDEISVSCDKHGGRGNWKDNPKEPRP